MKTPIADSLPEPLRSWWHWSETGLQSWGKEVPTVIAWVVVAMVLLCLMPVSLIGQGARLAVWQVRRPAAEPMPRAVRSRRRWWRWHHGQGRETVA